MSILRQKIINNRLLHISIISLLLIILMPIIQILIEIILAYGNLVGTYARLIIEDKICLNII